MRRVIAAMNITSDGFTAGPDGNLDWHFDYWDDELCESFCCALASAHTLLLGANTYKALAGYWPAKIYDLSASKQELIMAGLLNERIKIVVSKTITHASWQHTLILNGELITELDKLKKLPGTDILILGSSQLVTSLTRQNLIDRYICWIHPIAIQNGAASFHPNYNHCPRTEKTEHFRSGVIKRIYNRSTLRAKFC